ncbi:hypothetical protein [Streptomyces sp. NPDC051211]|uniref:hypothetical protein n=1 Tax=Streptomyces sp. NPDC051211 TaxID=3154643 RepID=UPI00344EA51E
MMNTRTLLASAVLAVGVLAVAAVPASADGGPPKPDQDTSIYPGATNKLDPLNQVGQLSLATGALDPVFGLLAPVTGVVPV